MPERRPPVGIPAIRKRQMADYHCIPNLKGGNLFPGKLLCLQGLRVLIGRWHQDCLITCRTVEITAPVPGASSRLLRLPGCLVQEFFSRISDVAGLDAACFTALSINMLHNSAGHIALATFHGQLDYESSPPCACARRRAVADDQ